ncbi:hypothetical protein DFO73_101164 [Cytobacillus oceanisediminis]|uniref:Uncharacterized protein n=1 Tax=Cytobacillus oceanisediminis TaxID=665099 RepID=A0A2V3A599_9BACI|nr:hypothetical protein DFO73_101164 [Cytobacillus oceanisediminis]
MKAANIKHNSRVQHWQRIRQQEKRKKQLQTNSYPRRQTRQVRIKQHHTRSIQQARTNEHHTRPIQHVRAKLHPIRQNQRAGQSLITKRIVQQTQGSIRKKFLTPSDLLRLVPRKDMAMWNYIIRRLPPDYIIPDPDFTKIFSHFNTLNR